MRYTYFVAYTAVHNDLGRVYGRCQLDSKCKISSFDEVKSLENDIEDDVKIFRLNTVVITNFKVIKRRINWWWSK